MLSKQIALYLQSQSLGTVGTDLFYGFLPPSPDTLTTIFDTGGEQGMMKLGYDYPTIQVRTRAAQGAASVETAYNRLAAIYNVLHGLHGITLTDGTLVVDSTGLQSAPITIGKDEETRAEFTLNFRLNIRNKTLNRE